MRAKDHPLHRTYEGMMERCYYLKSARYHRYGGRGVTVCDRWLRQPDKKAKGFWNFVEDMGARPIGATLDRIDNDGNYSPENCRWADPHTQSGNREQKKGQDHWASVLTLEQVLEARVRLAQGESRPSVARSLGVSIGCIQCIHERKTWKQA